jgi:hypothetical protein
MNLVKQQIASKTDLEILDESYTLHTFGNFIIEFKKGDDVFQFVLDKGQLHICKNDVHPPKYYDRRGDWKLLIETLRGVDADSVRAAVKEFL